MLLAYLVDSIEVYNHVIIKFIGCKVIVKVINKRILKYTHEKYIGCRLDSDLYNGGHLLLLLSEHMRARFSSDIFK